MNRHAPVLPDPDESLALIPAEEDVQAPPANSRTHRLATQGQRLGAVVLDFTILHMPLPLCAKITPILVLVWVAGFLGVNLWMLKRQGQSLGKRLVGIRIVRERDACIPSLTETFWIRGVLMSALYAIPWLGMLIFFFDVMFISRKDRKCLHDHIAGTRVIRV